MSSDDDTACVICRGGVDAEQEPLEFLPCACRGSIRAHRGVCMNSWLEHCSMLGWKRDAAGRNTLSCNVCRARFAASVEIALCRAVGVRAVGRSILWLLAVVFDVLWILDSLIDIGGSWGPVVLMKILMLFATIHSTIKPCWGWTEWFLLFVAWNVKYYATRQYFIVGGNESLAFYVNLSTDLLLVAYLLVFRCESSMRKRLRRAPFVKITIVPDAKTC